MQRLKNERFLRALNRQPVDATPIWIMRQAGRYLPEYRKLRTKTEDFLMLCKTPELACEATLQPLARFELDAAIIFSDILTIPDAMGLGLYFEKNEGPRFQNRVQNLQQVINLPIPDVEKDLSYVMESIRLVSHELAGRIPLIGFSGSPWTLATYMIEGGSSKNFQAAKQFLYAQPDALITLLNKLVEVIMLYLQAQIKAGAQVVMLFDTWGGLLNAEKYLRFSLDPMKKITAALKKIFPEIPIILFTKNGGQWLKEMSTTGCNALGVDWSVSLQQARYDVQDRVALQGNMDPATLFASKHIIKQEVEMILDSYGNGPGHIFNLGHGILPETSPEHVEFLVNTVHEQSALRYKNIAIA